MYLIIGNLIALVASIIMVYSGFLKNKKEIIYTQTIQIILYIISKLILGGITGAIINFINCIRNILCYKDKLDIKSKIILIVVASILSIKFNNLGIIGFLPVISTATYTIFMNTKSVIKLKLLIMFTMVLWLIYDLYIKSYTSAIFNLLNFMANLISIIKIKRLERRKYYVR